MKKEIPAPGSVPEMSGRPAHRYFTTEKIASLAMLVAVNVAVGIASPRIGSLKITLTYTMCYLAGAFYGAVAGGVVGGLGDLIGSLAGGFAPNPFILLSSVLLGVVPGLLRRAEMKRIPAAAPYVRIGVSYCVLFVLCTLFINTYGLYVVGMAKGASFWAFMGIRAAAQSPVAAMNLLVTIAVYPVFVRITDAAGRRSRADVR